MTFAATYIDSWLRLSARVDRAAIQRAIETLAAARNRDAIVWTVGNGGGSALASHLAIGLTLNTRRAGGRPFRAISLGADATALSAATNDFGADDSLRAILECTGRAGDVLVAFSVSGESPNIVSALEFAKELEMDVVAVVGRRTSTAAQLADVCVPLGSLEPGLAEDVASAVMHAIYGAFMYEHAALPAELVDAD